MIAMITINARAAARSQEAENNSRRSPRTAANYVVKGRCFKLDRAEIIVPSRSRLAVGFSRSVNDR